MKKKIIAILSAIIVLLGGGAAVTQIGGSHLPSQTNLIGSSSNLVSLPNEAVFANSTTTNASASGILADGGSTLTQRIDTTRADTVLLNIQAIGGTATSTLYVRQMGSFDGTTYYDVATTSVAYINPGMGLRTATSTVLGLDPTGFQLVPGTATTTPKSFPFQVSGYRYTRFIIYGDDLTSDPNDGVQAWITATKLDPIN